MCSSDLAASSTPTATNTTVASPKGAASTAQPVTPKTAGNPGPPDVASQRAIVSPRDPASGLPTGKRMHQSVMITKQVDKASPVLMQAVATGAHFKEVVIEFYRGGALAQRYRLKDALISSVRSSGAKAGEAKRTETVTLVAAEITEEK